MAVNDLLVRLRAPGRGDGFERRVPGQADARGPATNRTGDRPRVPADERVLDSHARVFNELVLIRT